MLLCLARPADYASISELEATLTTPVIEMNLNAMYVTVNDMTRALTFYKAVFQREPVQAEERFSMFDLSGTYFGLFCAAVDGEEIILGNNCVPNIEVEQIEAEYERIRALAPTVDPEIRQAKTFRYFQFKDIDGNLVEIYSQDGRG